MYVAHDDTRAVLIDPGTSNEAERQAVLAYLQERALTPDRILLTHGHVDHVLDCAYFAERFGLEVWMHREDLPLLEAAVRQAHLYGLDMAPPPQPSRWLEAGEEIEVAGVSWTVLHCPGHSPGSVCFHDSTLRVVIGGDVLFQGSVGRTDLWRGSMPRLMRSIHEQLLPLDDETIVYPGHGEPTTIGHERNLNPFLI
jgi:hydroxyacylglutathione hydrolase